MNRITAMEDAVNNMIDKRPHSKEALLAFKPVLLEKVRWREKLHSSGDIRAGIDRIRLKEGVPVIRQTGLLLPSDPWNEIILSVISAAATGFPDLQAELERLAECVGNKAIPFEDFFRKYPDAGEEDIEAWSSKWEIRPAAVRFIMRTAAGIVLEKRAADLAGYIGDSDWDKGYCPVCGSFPSLAIIEEKIGRRTLHCSQCAFEWNFSRVDCPFCGNHAPEGMDFFFVSDKEQESAYVCHKCSRYIVTLNRVSDLHSQNREVSAISLAHMDMIMQDKGFVPMAACDWNVF